QPPRFCLRSGSLFAPSGYQGRWLSVQGQSKDTCAAQAVLHLLRPRMPFAVDLQQALELEMRVLLRRAERAVTEQLLDGAQVGAALEKMGRERVAQRVRVDAGRELGGVG